MVVLLAALGSLFLANPAWAQLADTCTDQPIYDVFFEDRLDEMLQDIVNLVNDALIGVAERLYNGIINSDNYRSAILAAMILYLTFYAVGFIFGFVPAVFGQVLMRLIKIGTIFMIMSPLGWFYFSEIVVRFFDEGTNYLINLFIAMASGAGTAYVSTDVAEPFALLEGVIRQVLSPKMFVMIVGSFTTGPYGPLMAMALLWGVFNLFMMILRAMEVYLLSLVVRTLLFGLGPIFFGFMMFDRTKQIFMGWVNQLVNFSLQPILLFAFLSFFVVLIEESVEQLMPPGEVELCYTKMEHVGKMPYDMQHWRFKLKGEVYEGEWSYKGPEPNFPFPIEVIDILIFIILAHLGTKMSTVVTELASEIASGTLRLDQVPGTINSWFNNLRGGAGHGMSATEMRDRVSTVRRN